MKARTLQTYHVQVYVAPERKIGLKFDPTAL